MLQQRQHAVADQVDGGLVAGDQQQPQHGEHLALVEPVSLFLGAGKPAQYVFLRVGAAFPDDRLEIGVEIVGGENGVRAFLGADRRLQYARAAVGPAPEARPVFRRHAQHFRDHDHRQRLGDDFHEVETGQVVDPVQKLVHEAADMRLQRIHRPWRECLADQPPQAAVVRWVEREHGGRRSGVRYDRSLARPLGLGAVIGEALPVGKNRRHILVAAEYPGVHQPAAVRLSPLAQHRIGGIGVLRVPVCHRVIGVAALEALAHEHGLHGGLADRLLQG